MIYKRPSKITINIFGNLFSKFWIAGTNIVFLPIYIKILGVDSYGLVGFYATLVGSMTLLDFGLSMTLNRELARSKSFSSVPTDTRNMVLTIEVIYLIIGLFIGICVFCFSDLIASKWINSEHISSAVISEAVKIMGIVLALQWPISLYCGGLFGLERQALCGFLDVLFATLRIVGVILVLKYLKNDIRTFFIWQAIINVLHLLTLRIVLWALLPSHPNAAKFSLSAIRQIKEFTVGITTISIVSFALSYADKIVVSKMLTLEVFAYYAFASSVGGGLGQFGGAITSAIFPRFSALSMSNNNEALIDLYHRSCRLMASLVLPIAITTIFFTPEILSAWTHNIQLVSNTVTLTRILISGTALNCLMHMPYHLMLAKGNTRFTIIQNIIATIIAVPLLFTLIKGYGVIGASCVWLLINLSYVLISLPLVHRMLIPGESSKWYFQDTLFPLTVSIIIIGFFKVLFVYVLSGIYINLLCKVILVAAVCCFSIFICIPKKFIKALR